MLSWMYLPIVFAPLNQHEYVFYEFHLKSPILFYKLYGLLAIFPIAESFDYTCIVGGFAFEYEVVLGELSNGSYITPLISPRSPLTEWNLLEFHSAQSLSIMSLARSGLPILVKCVAALALANPSKNSTTKCIIDFIVFSCVYCIMVSTEYLVRDCARAHLVGLHFNHLICIIIRVL